MCALLDARHALSTAHRLDDAILRHRRSIRQAEHSLGSKMPRGFQRGRESLRHR
jgi:hypothetical protein